MRLNVLKNLTLAQLKVLARTATTSNPNPRAALLERISLSEQAGRHKPPVRRSTATGRDRMRASWIPA
jgi:hypothetical protein